MTCFKWQLTSLFFFKLLDLTKYLHNLCSQRNQVAMIYLASSSDEAKIWDVPTFSLVEQFNPFDGCISDITWSHDGKDCKLFKLKRRTYILKLWLCYIASWSSEIMPTDHTDILCVLTEKSVFSLQ